MHSFPPPSFEMKFLPITDIINTKATDSPPPPPPMPTTIMSPSTFTLILRSPNGTSIEVQFLPSISTINTVEPTVSMRPTLLDSASPLLPTPMPTTTTSNPIPSPMFIPMSTTTTSNPTPSPITMPMSTMMRTTPTSIPNIQVHTSPAESSVNSSQAAILTMITSPADTIYMSNPRSSTKTALIDTHSLSGTDTGITPMPSNSMVSTRISSDGISSVQSTSQISAGGQAHLAKASNSIIAGAVGGAILLLAAVVGLCLFFRRQRRRDLKGQMVSSLPDSEHEVAYSICITSGRPDLAKTASIGISDHSQSKTSLNTDNAILHDRTSANELYEKRVGPAPMTTPCTRRSGETRNNADAPML